MDNLKTECPFQIKDYKSCFLFGGDSQEDILIIGDSHAGHFVPGLSEYQSKSLKLGALILNGGCPPFYMIDRVSNGLPIVSYDDSNASCIEVNNARLNYALESNAKTIIFSFRMTNLFEVKTIRDNFSNPAYTFMGNAMEPIDALRHGFSLTMEKFAKSGKNIVLLYDNPNFSSIDFKRCNKLLSQIQISLKNNCSINASTAYSQQQVVISMLESAAIKYPNITTIDVLKFLCPHDRCSLLNEDINLYRDPDHLSFEGSRLLSKWVLNHL